MVQLNGLMTRFTSNFHTQNVLIHFLRLICLISNAKTGFGILFAVFVTAIVFALANLANVTLTAILEAGVEA